MIRLTPLRETASFQELLKEERVTLLLLLIESKFTFLDTVREGLRADLANLPMDALPMLFPQMLHIDSLEQLEQWIADRLPVKQA
jgi:hypothetical protein